MSFLALPENLKDLWEIWQANPKAVLYCGGTDVLPHLASLGNKETDLICLERIQELKGIKEIRDNIEIKACATYSEILKNKSVQEHLPILCKAIENLGSLPIRNMGSMAGNIATASPAGDCLPPLYVLKAKVVLQGRSKQRSIPIQDFIKGPGKTALLPGEIIFKVIIPKPKKFNLQHYEKVGQRNALAISLAGLAAMLEISEDLTIKDASLAFGSVGPVIQVFEDLNEFLINKTFNLNTLKQTGEMAQELVNPISDIRASQEYRRLLCQNLILRLQQNYINDP